MKCRKCGAGAVIELRRHNTAFCAPDFLEFFRNQAREAIRRHRMFRRDERVLVKSFFDGQEYLYRLVKMLAGGK